jgi:hypothetical protein
MACGTAFGSRYWGADLHCLGYALTVFRLNLKEARIAYSYRGDSLYQ